MLPAYNEFCAYLQRVSGIVLGEEKQYLVESRLFPIIEREKMSGLVQLVGLLESGRAPALQDEVIHAMTINETYFFRDRTPFDTIGGKIMPRMCETVPPSRPIRIWSAACSTGQEPYSLSMLVQEEQALFRGRVVEIIGTDVSEKVLGKAREGLYSKFEVERGLSAERLRRHFTGASDGWRVSKDVRRRVTFRALNLLASYTLMGQFDLILCRNVLIYFNMAQKGDVLLRLSRCLQPGGILMLGASESALGTSAPLVSDPECKGCYRRARDVAQ